MVAALLAALAVLASPPPASADLERALGFLERLDGVALSVDYHEEPLANVVKELAARSGLPVRADWDSLQRLNVRSRDPVTLRIEQAPLRTILSGLMLVLGDELSRPVWEVHADQVVVTSLEATASMRLTEAYDVRDLLADGETLDRLRAEDEPPPAAPRWTPGAELMHLLIEHIDPEAWIDFGGSRARISERGGLILVTAAPTVHRKILRTLARLRAANPATLSLDMAIVELPAPALTRLQRTHDAGSRQLAWAILRHEQARTLWRSAASVMPETRVDLESKAGETAIEVALTPRRDEAGLLRVEVAARTLRAGEERRVTTVVHLTPLRGGVTIEMPAAEPGPRRQLLVLVP